MKNLGYLGVLIIQCSYWPQIYRVVSTRQMAGLSPVFILLVWLGLVLLQLYSYSTRDRVYIFSNWFGLANTSLLLLLIWLWG
jgi:uncharacterized protein with PQ loop repeat